MVHEKIQHAGIDATTSRTRPKDSQAKCTLLSHCLLFCAGDSYTELGKSVRQAYADTEIRQKYHEEAWAVLLGAPVVLKVNFSSCYMRLYVA